MEYRLERKLHFFLSSSSVVLVAIRVYTSSVLRAAALLLELTLLTNTGSNPHSITSSSTRRAPASTRPAIAPLNSGLSDSVPPVVTSECVEKAGEVVVATGVVVVVVPVLEIIIMLCINKGIILFTVPDSHIIVIFTLTLECMKWSKVI